jgi:predicted anti-sigma-YlaC factor YlaD
MKCIKEQKLWEYLDDEVSSAEKTHIETHLSVCAECQEHLEEINFFDAEFSETINTDFQQARQDTDEIIEIELSAGERKAQLQKCWMKLASFGISVVLATSLLFVFACPISNYHIYESGFHKVTYGISQFLVLMLTPSLMSIWVIVVTFGILFKIDKMWLNRYREA